MRHVIDGNLQGRRFSPIFLFGSVTTGLKEIVILMVVRAGKVLIPEKDTALRANDTLILVGDNNDVVDFARLISRNGH